MDKEIVLIDCDPGVDDAYALLYALADESLDVRLIATVSGNVPVDVTTDNAQRIVAMTKKNVPIVKGSKRPLLKKPHYAENIHGKNGMNNYIYPNDNKAPLLDEDVLTAYRRIIMSANKPVVISATGPLTNIARLFLTYPEVKDKIKLLSVMGGGLKGGNTTFAAEFNFYVDPDAASIVFDSGVEIIMAGLDVTEKATITNEFLSEISQLNDKGKFLADIMTNDSPYVKMDSGCLHDVVALMAIKHLDIFQYQNIDIYIETEEGLTRGMTIKDFRTENENKGKVKVLLDLDINAFRSELKEKIKNYSKY